MFNVMENILKNSIKNEINKVDEIYELTNPQQSIWVTEQFFSGSSINNVCGTVLIDSVVDFIKLKEAIYTFVQENDNFRIRIFFDENREVMQKISDFEEFDIPVLELSNNDDLILLEKQMATSCFNLIEHALFNFKMFRFANGSGGFVLCTHHLIADACSAGLIGSGIMAIYSSLLKNEVSSDLPTSYVNYIKSEKNYLSSDKFKKDKEFWDGYFNTIPELGVIPSLKSSAKESCNASRKLFIIPKSYVEKINDFCSNNKVSVFNFFMAVYAIYISKISNLDDFVLGTPILNRSTFLEKITPGMFISTVPIRFRLDNNTTILDFIKKIAMDSLGLFRHQKYPYQNILEHIRKTNPSQPNLYDILISYQNTKINKSSSDIPYEVRWTFNGNVADSMQIHLFDMNDSGSLNIAYDYRLDKYNDDDICNIHNRICFIIEQILNNGQSTTIKDIEIIDAKEKNLILNEFNKTDLAYDKNKNVICFFEEQVAKTPNNIALVYKNSALSYKELNERVNSLAYFLRNNGIKNNSIVGVMQNRSFEMIISILAVLKAGGAYIPIDPEYPEDRISYMLSNSKSPVLISAKHLNDKIRNINFNGNVIFADLDNTQIYSLPNDNIKNISTPDDLSYIIYTSGSTGMPKGVMLNHKNLSNFINSMINKISYLNDGSYHSIVSITTVSFDIFAFETLVSLCRGLRLFITDESEQKITLKLERLIIDNNIEIIQSTPSIMNFHVENLSMNGFSKLKYVMLAGEQLPKQLVDKIKVISPNCIVYNGYGPSETTIFSTVKDVTNLETINIGEPIGNTQIYILNKDFSLLPIKTIGEIYISGDGVGNGYLNRDDLTLERYIANPFKENSIMYKTGDLGLWLPNGSIECRGRADNQVKLRGLRIELGEIEEQINSFDRAADIKSAVIIKNEDNKSSLNAFISSKSDINISDLKEYLSTKLPNYMIPNTFTILEKLPFTPNGKIDRKVLANYKIQNEIENISFVKPRNEIESYIVDSIKRKLCLDNFGIDNNIFDYGADSLAIINILTDLFQYNLSLKVYDFYKFPTVRALYYNVLSTSATVSLPLNNSDYKLNDNLENFSHFNEVVNGFSTNTSASCIYDINNVFLTGATGFLGIHILAELLDNYSSINKIYCAIRRKNNLDIKARLMNKVHFYFGNKYDSLIDKYVICVESDINKPYIGLSNNTLESLKGNIDTVIHCAANVKHYGNYADFERTNIEGTKNIIALCNKLNIPLNYISTMTISGNYLIEQNNNSFVFDENTFFKNQSFNDNVYSKSKLIAESIVLGAIDKGLNATIFRIGDLTGRYSDGVFQENIEDNSIYLRLKSILEIGFVPESIFNNNLEFTPVDFAASSICKIIHSDKKLNRIFHIYNPNTLKVHELIDYINKLNYNIEILSDNKFLSMIKDLSIDINNQSKIGGIINDFTNDNDLVYNHIIETNNNITCNYLNSLNFSWPVLDFDYINLLINYMKNVGFLKL